MWQKDLTPNDFELGHKERMMKDVHFAKKWEKTNSLKEINYPINFCGHIIDKPNPATKDRNMWIVGKPNERKTFNMNKTFKGLKVFIRSNDVYPFEDYNDEDIVIYDDYLPKFTEIADVCNTWEVRKRIYGGCRYHTKYWGENSRTVIVLTNTRLKDYCGNDESERKLLPAMKARFKEYRLINDKITPFVETPNLADELVTYKVNNSEQISTYLNIVNDKINIPTPIIGKSNKGYVPLQFQLMKYVIET